jgi:hemoglobin/transferrin/lactoferrin receptor protein
MKCYTLLIFYFLFFTSVVFAQEDTTAKALQEVVVTALRTKQEEQKIPYAVSTIQRKELNQFSPRTTPEALMGLTGVFVQKTNHGGGSAFVRGLTGNQTLMLVDGIRLNNSTFRYGPNQYLNTIDPFTIQRIEVVKGTGSVQYGTDALGGVIQIITKEPELSRENKKRKISGNAIGKLMTGNMEQTARAGLTYSSSTFAATGGFTIRNFGDIIGGDTTNRQSPSGYKEISYDAKLKFKLSSQVELIAAHQFLRQQQVPVYHKIRLENFFINEMDPQQRMLSYAKIHIRNNNNFIRSIEITASHQQNIEGRNTQKNGSTVLRKEKDEVNTLGFTVDIFSAIKKNWTANSGVEIYHDNINSTRYDVNLISSVASPKRGLYPDNSKYGNASLFTLHQFQIQKFQINAGLRLNSFNIHISDTSLGKVNVKPSALVGNVAVLYNFKKHHHLFASFSNSYRAPNIDDMGTLGIVDFRYEVPAYDLQPEQSFNYELGYKFRSRSVNVTASLFYMRLQNLITRMRNGNQTINGYNVYIKENTDRAFIRGAEAETDIQMNQHFKLQGGVAYLFGQNQTGKEPMRRIPPFNGRIRATYQKSKWFAAAETWFAAKQNRLAQGDKDDNRIPLGGTPGFAVSNLYAGFSLKKLQVYTSLQNMFNKDYRTHGSGINGAGRSAWVHIQFMF